MKLEKVISEILKPLKMVLCSSREIVSLKKNLKLAGLPVFYCGWNESSLTHQFKWVDNTFQWRLGIRQSFTYSMWIIRKWNFIAVMRTWARVFTKFCILKILYISYVFLLFRIPFKSGNNFEISLSLGLWRLRPLEFYLLAVKAHPGALETHPGALESHSGPMEAHPGAVEAHPGALHAHPK